MENHIHQDTPAFLAGISHIDLKPNPMAYEAQYRSQCGTERGYVSVLLFLGQHGDCISSWHILEHSKGKFYLTLAGTVPCALLSNTPCSNYSPFPTTACEKCTCFLGFYTTWGSLCGRKTLPLCLDTEVAQKRKSGRLGSDPSCVVIICSSLSRCQPLCSALKSMTVSCK